MEIKQAIKKVVGGESFAEEEMVSIFSAIMSGEATPSQIAAFLTGLSIKGETVEEISGAVKVMREKALKVFPDNDGPKELLDTCGTGGTGKHTFNISTTSAFVLAGCGVKVAKHGNRAATSKCGSADVLQALGVKVDVPVEVTRKCILEIGIGFLFAPLFHEAMKHAIASRKEIGIKTIFNILGPLANPANATHQIIGVFDKDLTEVMAEVLGNLGTKRAYVVHGADGLDEATVSGLTRVSELAGGKVRSYSVSPDDFGLSEWDEKEIKGGDPHENAEMTRAVLSGEKGAKLEVVLLNAALGLMAVGKVSKMSNGVEMAREAITSGQAMRKLEELVKISMKGA